jgi:uncharacterized protein (DUF1800 family)
MGWNTSLIRTAAWWTGVACVTGTLALSVGCGQSSASTTSATTTDGTGAGTATGPATPASLDGVADGTNIAPPITLPIPKGAPIAFGTSRRDIEAIRLANQATFGASDPVIAEIKAKGERQWLLDQFVAPRSIYSRQENSEIHSWTFNPAYGGFCGEFATRGLGTHDYCQRLFNSSEPVKSDFFKQATLGPDQLRQRMSFALSQIFVISDVDLDGTYGFARYHQMLRDGAFGSYRDLLRAITLNPMMGTYLNMVNNDKAAPNENFARELLQLFSIGTCQLLPDGRLVDGQCRATYDNDVVREYAFALTGWTYPAGGVRVGNCEGQFCRWANPTFYAGPMKSVASEHDQRARVLLSGVRVPASRTPEQALDLVLDSIMAHPNIAPFVSIRLIRAFVTSNPSPAYVARVAAAFTAGRHGDIGSGVKGDLRATIAAILLDDEARSLEAAQQPGFGKLREPVLLMTGLLRALSGYSDGYYLGDRHVGSQTDQPLFNSPSVFNYYLLDYALPAADGVVAPEFGILHLNTVISRMYVPQAYFFDWWGNGNGLPPEAFPGTIGTRLDPAVFRAVAADPAGLVERLNVLLTAGQMTPAAKSLIVDAVRAIATGQPASPAALDSRVTRAAYLMAHSPDTQVQR